MLWLKILLYLAAFLLGGAVIGGGIYKVQSWRIDALDKQIGELKVENASEAAALTEIRKQQDDLKQQRDIAQTKSENVRVVSVDRIRENNSIAIGPGCDAAIDYGYNRVPVLVTHREGVIP